MIKPITISPIRPIAPLKPLSCDTTKQHPMTNFNNSLTKMPPTFPNKPHENFPSALNFKSNFLISFEGGWPKPDLKQLWDSGKLPTVKKGFYGDVLTHDNISREHLKAASKGGKKFMSNIVLASKAKNNGRGNQDIRLFCDVDKAKEYLAQFVDVKFKGFTGNEYVRLVKQTLKKLGVDLEKTV